MLGFRFYVVLAIAQFCAVGVAEADAIMSGATLTSRLDALALFCRAPDRPFTRLRMHMKFSADRPYYDPEKAARKLLEIANSVEVVQDGRIYIELISGPFLFREKATPAIQGWPRSGDRARTAGTARERNLCPVYACGAEVFV